MAVSWDDYLGEVMPDVYGCPHRVAIDAIRAAAIEFCNKSRVWREILDPDITLADGVEDYTLTPPVNALIMGVHKIQLYDPAANGAPDARPLPMLSHPHFDFYSKRTQDRDKPRHWLGVEPSVVRFYPIPDDKGYTAKIWATLKPTRDSTEGPDFLYNDWEEAIGHGAKAKLLAMVGRDWANPQAVQYHQRAFINDGWVEARIRDAKANSVNATTAQPRGHSHFGVYRHHGSWRF